MIIEWRETAEVSARRFLRDQPGLLALGQAIAALAFDPYPAEAFPWGTFQRLHVGQYRVLYTVEGDLIEIWRVDRV